MNLVFADIQQQQRDGRVFMLQSASITSDVASVFWSNWKSPAGEGMRKLLTVRKESSGWKVYRLRSLETENVWGSFSCSYSLRSTEKLLRYQPVSVQHLCDALLRNGAALDGSDTGIGKTYCALSVCRELSMKPGIICRKSGIAAWKRACAYMGVEPYFIVNWESAKRCGKTFPCAQRGKLPYQNGYSYRWNRLKNVLVVFDEAHLANHDDSQNSAFYLSSKGIPSLSLSATFADRALRMRPYFYMVGAMSLEQYAGFLQTQGHFINRYNELESMSEIDDMKQINKILFPRYGYRLSYDDPAVKPYFPEGVYQTHIISISEANVRKQNTLYLEMLEKFQKYREMGKTADSLVADMRYRQAAELLKAESLAELTLNYIEENRSVAIFVNFRETMAYLAKRLKTNSLIFGGQEQYKLSRQGVVDAFQSDKVRVVIAMADAGGVSLDLHDLIGRYPRISLVCPCYNPITLKQVLGRTRRANSKTIPVMKLVYSAGTVEERVAQIVNRKLANIAALNDGDLMEPDLFKLGIHGEERKVEV